MVWVWKSQRGGLCSQALYHQITTQKLNHYIPIIPWKAARHLWKKNGTGSSKDDDINPEKKYHGETGTPNL